MPCPGVSTGKAFLLSVLDHVDCQAETLGSYGFQSLARPGGAGAAILASALAIFVALAGFRMILGYRFGGRDVVVLILRGAIVVTLAASWPAVRTLAYDTVLKGPGQIVGTISNADTLAVGASGDISRRLQELDDAIVALTVRGTGRNSGTPGLASPNDFRGVALEDGSTMGWARVVWLAGTLAPIVAIRLVAGFLLALAPLLALGMLFEETRGLFAGWARGLVLCFLGSAMLSVVHGTQLAILEPWAADALQLRIANYATPAAPTELLAVNLAFAIAANLALVVMVRVAFQRGWIALPQFPASNGGEYRQAGSERAYTDQTTQGYSRVEQVVSAINRQEQTADASVAQRLPQALLRERPDIARDGEQPSLPGPRLGEANRRTSRRSTLAGQRRDRKA